MAPKVAVVYVSTTFARLYFIAELANILAGTKKIFHKVATPIPQASCFKDHLYGFPNFSNVDR